MAVPQKWYRLPRQSMTKNKTKRNSSINQLNQFLRARQLKVLKMTGT